MEFAESKIDDDDDGEWRKAIRVGAVEKLSARKRKIHWTPSRRGPISFNNVVSVSLSNAHTSSASVINNSGKRKTKEEERKAFKSAMAFVALFVVRHPHQQLFPFVYGNLFPFLLHHPNVIISSTKNTLRVQKKQVQWVRAKWAGFVVLGALGVSGFGECRLDWSCGVLSNGGLQMKLIVYIRFSCLYNSGSVH